MVNVIARATPTVNTNLAGFWCHVPLPTPDRCRHGGLYKAESARCVNYFTLASPAYLPSFSKLLPAGGRNEPPVPAAAAHRTRYGAALFRVFVRDLGPHAPARARRGQARCPRVAHLRQTSEDAARTGH